MRLSGTISCWLICALAACSGVAVQSYARPPQTSFASEELTLPLGAQADLLLKALEFDLESNYRTGYRIGIVYAPTDRQSIETKDSLQNVLPRLGRRPTAATPVPFFSAEQFRETLRTNNINVLYICQGNGPNLPTIIRIAKELNVRTSTGIEQYVRDGVAIGFHGVPRGGSIKPAFSVNRLTSKFDAGFLYEAWKTFK